MSNETALEYDDVAPGAGGIQSAGSWPAFRRFVRAVTATREADAF
ncbi:hypothetical protein [Streptomyces sp. NPDC005017]